MGKIPKPSQLKLDNLIKHASAFWSTARQQLPASLRAPHNISSFANFQESAMKVDLGDFKTLNDFSRHDKSTNECSIMEVYNNGDLMIMLMFLPSKFTIPAHDHPDMLVFSKVLAGEVIFDRFDLKPSDIHSNNFDEANSGLVQLEHKSELLVKTGEAELLFPHDKNIHSIEAFDRSIVLDVLFNNYDYKNRVCTLYNFVGTTPDGLYLATTETE